MVQYCDIVDTDLIWYHCKNELYNLLILYSLIIFIFSINKLINKCIFTRSHTEIILLNIVLYLCFRNYLSNNIFNELQINDYNITHSNNIFIKLKVIESKYNDIIKNNENINSIQNDIDIIKNKYKVLPDINKVNDIIKSNEHIKNDIDIIKKKSYIPELERMTQKGKDHLGYNIFNMIITENPKKIVKGWLPGEEILTWFYYLTDEWSSSHRTHILTTMGREVDYLTNKINENIPPKLTGEAIELSDEYMKIAEKYPKHLGIIHISSDSVQFFANLLNIFREYNK